MHYITMTSPGEKYMQYARFGLNDYMCIDVPRIGGDTRRTALFNDQRRSRRHSRRCSSSDASIHCCLLVPMIIEQLLS